MKKILFILICALGTTGLQAQSKCGINKAWAYYTVSFPGMQMSDENGNPVPPKPIIDRFIYIEWCGAKKKPDIKEVTYNDQDYEVVLEKVVGRSVVPGKDLSPENKTRIYVAKCANLWKLVLIPKDKVPDPESKQITIKLKTSSKCVMKLTKETQLKTLPRP